VKIQGNSRALNAWLFSIPGMVLIIVLFRIYRAREALRQCLPDELRDATFAGILRDDITSQRYLNQLLINLLGN
jgi:hypothetical protein